MKTPVLPGYRNIAYRVEELETVNYDSAAIVSGRSLRGGTPQ
jgi:hypothetical protein